MKLYLSSYKLGNEVEKLKELIPSNRRAAYVPNARDAFADRERSRQGEESDIEDLSSLGLVVERLDLREYFGQQGRLRAKVSDFGVIWVSGGNLFVLRQAFKLSGFDEIVRELIGRDDVVYGGYSAGVCILAPTLRGIDLMDDPSARPYGSELETIWDGLGVLEYSIVPHFRSNHPESEAAGKAADYMTANDMPFRALRDGEVIVLDVAKGQG